MLPTTHPPASRFCRSVNSNPEPCSHYVTGGVLHLSWPTTSTCCACCSSDTLGCGIYPPNWVAAGSYQGPQAASGNPHYSGQVDEWLVFPQNSFYEALPGGDGIPVTLYLVYGAPVINTDFTVRGWITGVCGR